MTAGLVLIVTGLALTAILTPIIIAELRPARGRHHHSTDDDQRTLTWVQAIAHPMHLARARQAALTVILTHARTSPASTREGTAYPDWKTGEFAAVIAEEER